MHDLCQDIGFDPMNRLIGQGRGISLCRQERNYVLRGGIEIKKRIE